MRLLRRASCHGFTLIELIVVVIVLGILMAVVLPRFFGVSGGSKDNVAKQYLTVAWSDLAAQQTANNGVWPSLASIVAKANADEPELTFVACPAAPGTGQSDGKTIYVALTGNDGIQLALMSTSGTLITAISDSTTNYQLVLSTGQGVATDCHQNGGAPASGLPLNTGPPSLGPPESVGAPQVGDVLTVSHGTWSGDPDSFTYGYAWERDGSTIRGADGTTYTVASADVGHALSVAVTATNRNSNGMTVADSDSSGVVGAEGGADSQGGGGGAPGYTTRPSLSLSAGTGTLSAPQVGDQLTADPGVWTGSPSLGEAWQRDGSPIGGASALTYTITSDDVGHALRIHVTATNTSTSGQTQTSFANSAATGTVAGAGESSSPPTNKTAPVLGSSGSLSAPKVGDVLTATRGTWDGATSYSYIWRRVDSAGHVHSIGGATVPTHTVGASDVGDTLYIHVTATNSEGSAAANSDATGTVTGSGAPTIISGREQQVVEDSPSYGADVSMAAVSYVLEAHDGIFSGGRWTGSPTSQDYIWQRDDNTAFTSPTTIGTARTYTVAQADLGQYIRVVEVATNASGTGSAISSNYAGPILPPPLPVNIVQPGIDDLTTGRQADDQESPTSGNTLSAAYHPSPGYVGPNWSGLPTSYSYQWQRANVGDPYAYAEAVFNDESATPIGYGDYLDFGATAGDAASYEPYDLNCGGPLGSFSGGVTYGEPDLVSEPDIMYGSNPSDAAASFDGSGAVTITDDAYLNSCGYDMIDPASSGSPNPTGTVSVETWVKPSALSGSVDVLVKPTSYRLSLVTSGGVTHARFSVWVGGDWQSATGTTALHTGSTYMLDGGYDGSTVTVYVNGASDGSTAYSGSLSDSYGADLTIGQNFVGEIDDTSIYPDMSLSSDQVATHYAAAVTPSGGWMDIPGATGETYVTQDADIGAPVRVTVTAHNATGDGVASSDGTGPVLPEPPTNTALPSISGTAQEGQTLSVSPGAWTSSGITYTYQWYRCAASDQSTCAAITGAIYSNYSAVDADVGYLLRAAVDASNTGGSIVVFSNPTTTVLASPPANTAAPVISGGPAAPGIVLTASTGTWAGSPTSYSYQWQHNANQGAGWVNVTSGGTASSYTVAANDANDYMRVMVTAFNAGGSTTALSSSVAPLPVPTNTGAPVISGGPAAVGVTLSVTTGTWANSPTSYSYQWQRLYSGVDNYYTNVPSGGTASTYTVAAGDGDYQFRVQVTAINAGGSSAPQSSSNYIAPAPPVNTSPPVISGTPVVGQTLTATAGGWSSASPPTSYSFQWQNSIDGSNWGNAGGTGANTSVYTIAADDQVSYLRVQVWGSNYNQGGGQTGPVASSATTIVHGPPISTGSATISGGTPQVGHTLTTDNGPWAAQDAPTSYTYQWQYSSDGSNWGNANWGTGWNTSSYTVAPQYLGDYLHVLVTGHNAYGWTSRASWQTGIVLNLPPELGASPVVSGSTPLVIGHTLTTTNGSWNNTPITGYSYQWQRCSGPCTDTLGWSDIGGATSSSYVLVAADVSAGSLRSVVTAWNSGGSTSAHSAHFP